MPQFVDPFEWRMGFTTGEKELSIREMNMAEVWCTVCRSARIVRMENGIYDRRKRVVDPRNEYG